MRAHLHDLRSEVEDQGIVDRFARDWRAAGLDEPTTALLEFTEKLTSSPSSSSTGDVERLRAVGWDDRAITDVVEVCAYFNYINRVSDGLGADPEDWLDDAGRERRDPAGI